MGLTPPTSPWNIWGLRSGAKLSGAKLSDSKLSYNRVYTGSKGEGLKTGLVVALWTENALEQC